MSESPEQTVHRRNIPFLLSHLPPSPVKRFRLLRWAASQIAAYRMSFSDPELYTTCTWGQEARATSSCKRDRKEKEDSPTVTLLRNMLLQHRTGFLACAIMAPFAFCCLSLKLRAIWQMWATRIKGNSDFRWDLGLQQCLYIRNVVIQGETWTLEVFGGRRWVSKLLPQFCSNGTRFAVGI